MTSISDELRDYGRRLVSMSKISDERREVAARLRDEDHGYGTEYDFFLRVLGMSREGNGPCDWTKVHKRLADLIEPEPEKTCHIKPDEKASEECCGPMLSCDACGTWIPPINGPYRYCPYCGARVVDGGDA